MDARNRAKNVCSCGTDNFEKLSFRILFFLSLHALCHSQVFVYDGFDYLQFGADYTVSVESLPWPPVGSRKQAVVNFTARGGLFSGPIHPLHRIITFKFGSKVESSAGFAPSGVQNIQ